MESFRDRRPVIVPLKDYVRWLAATDPGHLPINLLKPYPAEDMKAYRVGKAVGNTRNGDSSLIEPVHCEEPGPKQDLFGSLGSERALCPLDEG